MARNASHRVPRMFSGLPYSSFTPSGRYHGGSGTLSLTTKLPAGVHPKISQIIDKMIARFAQDRYLSYKEAAVDMMVKKHDGATYIFAVNMKDHAKAEFTVKGLPARAWAEPLGETYKIAVTDGKFTQELVHHGVYLYKITKRTD